MRKKFDPLWEIVDERVGLQGSCDIKTLFCPRCQVAVELPQVAEPGWRFSCGLCGAQCEVALAGSIADDGSSKVVARLAE